ncbi:TraR/DksA C4-type zinc finger protein [Candidatus Parcubacteria bacterium]|nr:TraR/DksA C4-type zinc finger protein [Candidatus Parcubacteria bacterium]
MNTQHYKARLEEEKAKLETELESVGRRNPSNPKDWEAEPAGTGQESDSGDAGMLIEEFEENTGILKELETRYNEVLAALTRIEKGTYGTCEVSGEPIEEERLNADPAARTCKAHIDG